MQEQKEKVSLLEKCRHSRREGFHSSYLGDVEFL